MLDLSEKEIIPACIKYLKEISEAENIIGLKNCNATSVIKNDIAKLIDGAFEQLNILRELKVETQKISDATQRATTYTQKVIPVMNCLRDYCDDLEKKIPSGYWPFPNYAEILFRV
jgi:glutamine synthetase